MNIDKFVPKQLELLEIEKEADIEETRCLHEKTPSKELEHQGVCIRKLKVDERKSGLYGRTLITFGPQWVGKQLPAHHISSGDIVGVNNFGEYIHQNVIISGVVSSTKSNSITVAFDMTLENVPLEDSVVYSLVKLANDVTYKRIKNALLELKKFGDCGRSHLIDVLYEKRCVSEPLPVNDVTVEFHDKNLNSSQREAVKFALHQKEIAVIHGPPGTGKTTTLVETIRQLVSQKLKILVCAPSNVAVDNLAEMFAKTEVKIVRLGHPARTSLVNQNVSLDVKLQRSDNAGIIEDIRKDLDSASMKIRNSKDKCVKRQRRSEIKELAKELRRREIAAVKEVLSNVDVVLATLVSAYPGGPLKQLPEDHFDVVVIDECSQALEAACLIPILQAKKCILAGDHKQLPPTIISQKAAKEGLEITLMERLLSQSKQFPNICRMLNMQYRMHKNIMKWPSDKLYGGQLVADSSVENHLLKDLPNIETNDETVLPLLLIDTAGCNYFELELKDEISKGNEDEANLVVYHLKKLIQSGVLPLQIAVITPYNLQVEILRSLISPEYPGVEIRSVDGFQGREKEAVILSFVRSNNKGEVGFLAENRRLNVSVTRARRHLAVICDSETVCHDPFLKEFIDYMNQVGEVRSAHQYLQDLPSSRNHLEIVSQKIMKLTNRTGLNAKKAYSTAVNDVSKPKLTKHTPSSLSKPLEASTEEMNKRTEYRKILEKFKSREVEQTYSFSSTLSPFERRLVHEVAEKLGLLHISQGEGEQRQIIISKNERKPVKKSKVKQVLDAVDSSVQIKVEKDDSSCDSNEEPESQPVKEQAKCLVKKKQKKSNKKQPASLKPQDDIGNEDFDAILNEFVQKDNRCCFQSCKVSTVVLGQNCRLCGGHFCFSHSLPEVHGCGEAAKVEARKQAFLDFERQKSSTSSGQGKNPNRLTLERKLDKKLNEFGDKRTRKPPKTSK